MEEKEAMLAEIKRIKAKNRKLTAEMKAIKRGLENGEITLDVKKDPQFRDDLAEVIYSVAQGHIIDRVVIDPVRGRIHTTGSEPSTNVLWRLVPVMDLVDPDLDVSESDIALVRANIVNEVIITLY